MKKIVLGTLGIFVGSLLLVSCSSESNVLSSFSKRKYLKNFKETKKSYEVVIEEETAQLEETKTNESIIEPTNPSNPIIEENNLVLTQETVELTNNVVTPKKVAKQIEKEYRNWDKFNRTYQNELLVSNEQYNHSQKSASSFSVNEIVLAILAIFIPPLAVYLHEDAITANFWVDLVLTLLFWLPGIIFAFLVIFAGVSL